MDDKAVVDAQHALANAPTVSMSSATANTVVMGIITGIIFVSYIFAGVNGWIMLS